MIDGAEGSIVEPLSGWGRYPVQTCRLFRPEKSASVGSILASGAEPSYIPRGLGRSYGDAALNENGGVISFERLDRFVAFDAEAGVLECEAGVSVESVIDHFLPRGYFVPVTLGTKFVTLGGAIASDVHGKNHHRVGTIASFLVDFRLLTPAGDAITCSRDLHPDVFWATVGGLGLTGFIQSLRLRLQPVETAYVLVDYRKAPNVDEALAAMEGSDASYEYSVAWIDCLARGPALGRSVLMRGNPAAARDLPSGIDDPLSIRRARRWSVPFDFPTWGLNRSTVGAFNEVFYRKHSDRSGELVDYDSYFYPLDSIRGWNRMYGRRGFVQYQVVLPSAASRAGLIDLLERFSASGRASFLAVLKSFGPGNPGLLSFPLRGYTLTLDLPMQDGLVSFLREMDEVVLGHGGRVYLAKDAVTTPETFARMYPQLGRFREIRDRLDTEGRLSSSLSRRVGIAPGPRG
ncbi:MAG TPA: FAD-binding oxidoreductase [Thermoanaerobaculia bacterium]